MPAKSWAGKYFPDARAHLVVHFANSAFEMADEFTRNTFPFRFTIPPASLDPLVPRPGPYLFHGGGMQNPQYPLLSTNALQFMPAASLRSTSSSASSPHLPQVPAKAARTVRPKDLLTEAIFFFKVARFCNLNLLSKRLKFLVKFHSENRCQV
jgi:hypothetical protein